MESDASNLCLQEPEDVLIDWRMDYVQSGLRGTFVVGKRREGDCRGIANDEDNDGCEVSVGSLVVMLEPIFFFLS